MDHPFVNIHTHRRTGEGIELVSAMAGRDAIPPRPCSVGIHPWQVDSDGRGGIAVGKMTLAEALYEVETAAVDAIGETGLDYARPVSHRLQEQVFRVQLAIARKRGLPVVIHCVRAFEPVMEALRGCELRAVIFHGFTGSPQQARRAVEDGYYLSFGERGLGSRRSVDAMRSIPPALMMLETDESGLPIGGIYSRAAGLLGADMGELKKQVYINYLTIFGE